MLADAISEAVSKDPVDPAFEDRRHGEPPEREVKDERVGPDELLDLAPDVAGQCILGKSVTRSRHRLEAFLRGEQRKIGLVDMRLPAFGIEIADAHLMALSLKLMDGDIAQRAIERAGFRMGENI